MCRWRVIGSEEGIECGTVGRVLAQPKRTGALVVQETLIHGVVPLLSVMMPFFPSISTSSMIRTSCSPSAVSKASFATGPGLSAMVAGYSSVLHRVSMSNV